MKEMKTLNLFGAAYEIVDAKARSDIQALAAGGNLPSGGGSSGGSGGVSSWNDLTDKPFYEEAITITDDGNSEGKDSFEEPDGGVFYKIGEFIDSDVLSKATYELTIDGSTTTGIIASPMADLGVIAAYAKDGPRIYAVKDAEGAGSILGITIPSNGLYIPDMLSSGEVTQFSITIQCNAIKKIDAKYLYQPDYDQPDITAADYIHNKPISIIQELGEKVVDNESLDFTSSIQVQKSWGFGIELGRKYLVNWNGTDYECTAETITGDVVGLGEMSVMASGTYTELPFLIVNPDPGFFLVVNTSSGVTIPLSISEYDYVPVIDKRYLPAFQPDWSESDVSVVGYINNKTHWEEQEEVLLDNEYLYLSYDGTASYTTLDEPIRIVAGSKYKITIDGNEYVLTAAEGAINGMTVVYIGDIGVADGTNTTHDFLLGYLDVADTTEFCKAGSVNNVTVSLVKQYQIHTLDEKFIPDTVLTSRALSVISRSGGYYSTAGDWVADESLFSKCTDLIPVTAGDNFRYTGCGMYAAASVLWYDSNNTLLSYEQHGADMNSATITVTATENASYVRFCSFNYGADTVELEVITQLRNDVIPDGVGGSSGGSDGVGLPTVTAENNGAFLRVVDGAWAVATIESAEGVGF